jgi:GNAT superfamily N-acetyltransferase
MGPGSGPGEVVARSIVNPGDPALVALSELLHATFADPDTVLELDRIQRFLSESSDPGDETRRQFYVVVAEAGDVLVGGTIFSYVPATNCGFSEYLVARQDRRGQGIGRLLFDARRTILTGAARSLGHVAARGLFIEADNPQRVPHDLLERERSTALDAETRLHLFAHLGFWRVDLAYAQPSLGPAKEPVTYLDLLFAPWTTADLTTRELPIDVVRNTLRPIWSAWAPETAEAAAAALASHLGTAATVALLPL